MAHMTPDPRDELAALTQPTPQDIARTRALKRMLRMNPAEIEAEQRASALRLLDAAYADEGGYTAHVAKEIDTIIHYNDYELTQRMLPTGQPRWSPQAYANLRGLKGPAADMFTEIATLIQQARGDTPW